MIRSLDIRRHRHAFHASSVPFVDWSSLCIMPALPRIRDFLFFKTIIGSAYWLQKFGHTKSSMAVNEALVHRNPKWHPAEETNSFRNCDLPLWMVLSKRELFLKPKSIERSAVGNHVSNQRNLKRSASDQNWTSFNRVWLRTGVTLCD